jgi:hypothetical protein
MDGEKKSNFSCGRNLMNKLTIFILMVLAIGTCHCYAMALTPQQLTYNDSNDINPQVSGPYTAWQGDDPNGGDWEIFFYDSESIIRLTDNTSDDINPQLFGANVVWQGWDANDGDWEIFYYDGRATQQLTDDGYDDIRPKISSSLIVWESWDGNDWEISTAALPVPAGMKVAPQSLNLKSKGKWVTVHLRLRNGMTAAEVKRTSLKLMDQIPVDKVLGGESPNKLTLKFSRSALQALLTPGPEVEVYLTGELKDGTAIEASDTIKVIQPGS